MKFKSKQIKDPVKQATKITWMTVLFMLSILIIFILSTIIGFNVMR